MGARGSVFSPSCDASHLHPAPLQQHQAAQGRSDSPAAQLVLPAAANRLLLGSDLPRGSLARAAPALGQLAPCPAQGSRGAAFLSSQRERLRLQAELGWKQRAQIRGPDAGVRAFAHRSVEPAAAQGHPPDAGALNPDLTPSWARAARWRVASARLPFHHHHFLLRFHHPHRRSLRAAVPAGDAGGRPWRSSAGSGG